MKSYHGGFMGRKNIFSSNQNRYFSGGGRGKKTLVVLLLVLVLGTALGAVIFKFFGEQNFTSKTPIVVTETPAETPEEPVVKPEDLVEDSNHIFAAAPYAYSTKTVREWITGQVPYTGEKLAFLTFDDGPSATNTGKLLDVLKAHNARATFFIIGTSIEKNANAGDTLNRILAEGSSLGLHSYSHVYDKLYPQKTGDPLVIQEEIQKTQDLIRSTTGKANFTSHVFRYPGGHMSWKGTAEVDALLAEDGIEHIDWNAMNGDSEPTVRRPKDAAATAAFVLDSLKYTKVKDVIVVLMHDAENKGLTLEALPTVIETLRNEGYTFGILK